MSTTAAPFSAAADVEAGSSPRDSHDEKHSLGDTESAHSKEAVHKTAGVLKMEAIAAIGQRPEYRWMYWAIGSSIFAMYWMYCQQGSTTYSYAVYATSDFQEHSSGIATTGIATSIISSVCLPFLAKLSDVFSRPWMSFVIVISYVVGFVMLLKSPNLATYIVGQVFVSIGGAGLGLLSSVITADLVSLKWRGFAQGVLSLPYVVIPWYSAYISASLTASGNWRWGYGMYSIIMPAVFLPGIAILFWMQRLAKREGIIASRVNEKADKGEIVAALTNDVPFMQRMVLYWHELDGVGLLLLGFGWSLLLLPFGLSPYADAGYNNRSLIAMFVVGAVCLVAYVVWEGWFARFPSAPMRLIKNKTFITAIIIDFIYMMAGYFGFLSCAWGLPPAPPLRRPLYLQLTYLSSYVYVVTDMTLVEYGYYTNTLTVALCFGGFVAGCILRYTHRYKFLQLFGLCVKIVGYGLLVSKDGVHDVARLVLSQVFTGIGGSFSVIGSQVSSQASVAHQDVALAISLLSLWTAIGGAIGQAISAAVWNAHMPSNLRKFIPVSLANDTEIATYFSAITEIRALDYSDPIRQGAIKAYEATVYPLWAGALGLSFCALIAACLQTNYYLGDTQNAFDGCNAAGEKIANGDGAPPKATGWKRVLRFWDL